MAFSKFIARSVVAAGALTLAAAPALAVTVENRAGKAHEVTVDLGATEPKTSLEAGKSAKLECPDGCEVRVDGVGYGLPAKSGEKLVIGDNGLLSYADAKGAAAKSESGKAKTKAD